MYKRYYDGYAKVKNDAGEIVIPQSINKTPCASDTNCVKEENNICEITAPDCGGKNSFLNLPMDIDDLILIGILLFLLFDKKDDCDDDDNNMFLLLIAGFVLLSDIL